MAAAPGRRLLVNLYDLRAEGFGPIVTARCQDRLEEHQASLTDVTVVPLVAGLPTDDGIDAVAEAAGSHPLSMPINNAGAAHYMPFAELPAGKAAERSASRNLPQR